VTSGLRAYRDRLGISQVALAKALGITQAYVSQLESGLRPVTRQLARRLAALPERAKLPATVFPPEAGGPETADADLAADLAALGHPAFEASARHRPRNPAAVIISIIGRSHVAPAVMAAVPWILLHFGDLDVRWLVDRARLANLQNRLGFLADLALAVARPRAASKRFDESHLLALESLRAELEESRLAKEDTLARELSPAERQFFAENRSDAARHWNLLTGLTKEIIGV